MYIGHVYICIFVCLLEILLFKELVKVRYNSMLEKIESTLPFFRTLQWCWFWCAIIYTYGEFAGEFMQNNPKLHYLTVTYYFQQVMSIFTFGVYASTFVLTIVTLQRDTIKLQLNQLCWTLCILFLTIGQLKYIMHNIFNGLFWFTFPVLLVVINDIMAYVSGMTMGKKIVKGTFLALSPNKTWEGFIGGGIFTIIFGWFLAAGLSKYTWMTCPVDLPTLFPTTLTCEPDAIFTVAHVTLPHQVFDILPDIVARAIPGISTLPNGQFELVLQCLPIQLHAIMLAAFASVVAPFGGFLASGIKRAYGIKDFDSLIPGHGGIMDRMDCQFLMALCAWVHYNAFVKMAAVSASKVLFMFKMLPEEQKAVFMDMLNNAAA